ncbi:MAG: hypothetical protein IJC48_11830 [Clostridia bacterium]|nr:hypothetical protein [Clostridia bacterium]
MKKTLAIVVALVLALSAFAYAQVPAALTTKDVKFVGAVDTNAAEIAAEFALVFDVDAEEVALEREQMEEFLKDETKTVIDYFPDEAQKDIGVKLMDEKQEGNLSLNSLIVTDFATVEIANYQESFGDVFALVDFAAEYDFGARVVGVLGLYDGSVDPLTGKYNVAWAAVKAEVTEEGIVELLLTEDDFAAVSAAKESALLILAVPGEGEKEPVAPPQTGSKTATDNTQIEDIASANGLIKDDFKIIVAEDKEPIKREIEKMYAFVNEENKAPAEYLPAEVLALAVDALDGCEISLMEINEFVTIESVNYKEEYGDIVVNIEFVTNFAVGQKACACLAVYTGETDEATGEYKVEWVVLEAVALENGNLSVYIPMEEVLRIQDEFAVGMIVMNEPKA